MISKENLAVLAKVMVGYPKPADDQLEALAKTKTWWPAFENAEDVGVEFEWGAFGFRFRWEGHKSEYTHHFIDLLERVEEVINLDEYRYPSRRKLREQGWRCLTTDFAAYMQKDEVIRPFFVNADAAWNDLLRSMP